MNRSFFFLFGERDVSVIPVVQYKENTTELVLTILTKNTKKNVQNPMGKKNCPMIQTVKSVCYSLSPLAP